ncbi:uncharacterized protein LOC114247633 [Bombyx mandarina]|uniref:Uncharacterized protein LOC114247633 n=1 Tax=Bombyx mandarina TaxID=7092 RepID=A0A6J2K830_BOMMA|nr:uncharacterized protein LOC114247633 [Bombyx mandarina]
MLNDQANTHWEFAEVPNLTPESNLTINEIENFDYSKSESKVLHEESRFIKFIESNAFIPFIDSDNSKNSTFDYIISPIDVHVEPQVIFDANITRKAIGDKLTKKSTKHKRIITFKNIHFKYKTPKYTMEKRFNTHYKNRYRKSKLDANYVINFDTNLSQLVSKPRKLKKVLAQENLLLKTSFCSNEFIMNANENRSIKSTLSAESSFLSASSNKTLTLNDSMFPSIHSVNLTTLKSPKNVNPYKTDVINVAVAVGCNKTKTIIPPFNVNEQDRYYFKSNETIVLPNIPLTSQVIMDSENVCFNNEVNNPKKEIDSLIGTKDTMDNSSFGVSCDSSDAYVIARTSSDFNSSNLSTSIQDCDSSVTERVGNKTDVDLNTNKITRNNTVINMGLVPDDNVTIVETNNNVAVTKELKKYTIDQNKSEITINFNARDETKNVLKKNLDVLEDFAPRKMINLPDNNFINAQIGENAKPFSDDLKRYTPESLADLWDRIVIMIDIAVKRIEDTIYKKIEEWKGYLNSFEIHKSHGAEQEVSKIIEPGIEVVSSIDENLEVAQNKVDVNESIQCNLIENSIIDKLALKLGASQSIKSKDSFKRLRTKFFRDYFEVIKPPNDLHINDDNETLSRQDYMLENVKQWNRIKAVFEVPLQYLKENAFVLASVPMFFLSMLCLYGLIVLVLNP